MRLQAIGTSLTNAADCIINAADCVKDCFVKTYIEDQAELTELLRPSSQAEKTEKMLESRRNRPVMRFCFGGEMTKDEIEDIRSNPSSQSYFFKDRLVVIMLNGITKRLKENRHENINHIPEYNIPTDKAHFGWIGNTKLMLASLPTTLVQLATQACNATGLGQIDALRMIGASMAKFAHALAFAVSVVILLVLGVVEIPFRVVAGGLDLAYNALTQWLNPPDSFNAGTQNPYEQPSRRMR